MAALTVAEGIARALSFAFYLIAARALEPAGFGIVAYTIALSTLAIAPGTSLGGAFMRELGTARGDPTATRDLLGSAPYLAVAVWIGSSLLCVIAGATGVTGSADVLGLLVVMSGLLAFRFYYALGRGIGLVRRIAAVYIAGSLMQLAVFAVLVTVGDPSPRTALIIFGVSSAAPIIALELVRPLIFTGTVRFARDAVARVWALAWRISLNPLFNLTWLSADLIWVESTLGTAAVGRYAAAKNMTQIFMVLISGANGVLLPRISELRARGEADAARRLMVVTTLRLTGTAAVLALLLVLFREPLLRTLFGSEYEVAGGALAGLAVSATLYTALILLSASAVSWGRPLLSTATVAIAATSEVALLLLVGGTQLATAAWISAASAGIALAFLLTALALRPLRADDPLRPGAAEATEEII